MRVVLILASNVEFSPYLKYYTQVLDLNDIDYDVVVWNRESMQSDHSENYIVYEEESQSSSTLIRYYRYAQRLKRILLVTNYDRIVVFTPQLALFIADILLSKYRGKYILDYRDLSIEQKPILKQLYSLLLKYSALNVLSSPGYIRYLPEAKYVINHNFDVRMAMENAKRTHFSFDGSRIELLTIGSIRNYSSNKEIIDACANSNSINLMFAGQGPASASLRSYVLKKGFQNVQFMGYYKKENETQIISKAHVLNLFSPDIASHRSAMFNRFYHSLIFKKPMIVRANSIQGEYVSQYSLGITIEHGYGVVEKIESFMHGIVPEIFEQRCNDLLNQFIADNYYFERKLLDVLNKK